MSPDVTTVAVFGANGGSGRAVVERCLSAGLTVRAVTRHPEQFPTRHAELTLVQTDATDADAVDEVIGGVDAVVSALGVPYSRGPISLYSTSARHIVGAMQNHDVNRLVVVSSSAVDPGAGRQGTFVDDHLVAPLIHRLGRTLYADHRRMERVVRESELSWTVVRPPALTDVDSSAEYRTSENYLQGRFATRGDVATFMVREIIDTQYQRKVAYIVSPDVRPSLIRTIWHDGLGK